MILFKIFRKILFYIPVKIRPFPNKPILNKRIADKKTYLKLFEKSKLISNSLIDQFERDMGFSINREWFLKLALHTQVIIKPIELNYFHGRVLYALLSSYLNSKNKNINEHFTIFETGTARGFSALCMAKALLDNNRDGKIITIDFVPHNKKIFWNCIDDCEGEKTRAELLKDWPNEISRIIFLQGWSQLILEKIGCARIHFAFIDGAHTKFDVLREFEYVSSRQKSGDIVLFDDVTEKYFPGIVEALNTIKNKEEYFINYIKLDEYRGYAVATKK